MAKLETNTASSNALVGVWRVALTTSIVATLYVARDLLIPLTLATLLTFVLAPLVSRLERRLGRVFAVLLVVMLVLVAGGASVWVLTRQLVDLTDNLPGYSENIRAKLRAFKVPTSGRFAKFSKTVEGLRKDLPGADVPEPARVPAIPGTAVLTEPRPPAPVAPVQMIEVTEASPIQVARGIIAPLVGPLGTAALVALLVIFMLLKREDLRGRLVRLVGQVNISATTHAMSDAGARVARFLLMQLAVNLSFGIAVGIGLYFIGVPNAALWGASATLLRFIPYVGPWVGAAIPIALALIVSPGWLMPLLTVGLFIALELLSNNVVEPWLYGSKTGVSPIALVFAAVCWTWLWGPLGLVLSTPLTVCLVVLGRHIPGLSFLSVLLSNEEPLTPAEDCYYRLLALGEQGEVELVESYIKAHSLTALYDSVLIPVITAIEIDHRRDLLDDRRHELVEQSLRDIIEDLGASTPRPIMPVPEQTAAADAPRPARPVLCLPARADRDELAGMMLAQLLRQQGHQAQSASAELAVADLPALVGNASAAAVCISVVAPSTVLHARYLCLKLRALMPETRILVGLWGATGDLTDAARRVRDSGADDVVASLADAVLSFASLLPDTAGDEPSG